MGNKINTVVKGDAFEDRVFAKIKELLESDMLAISGKHSKIFKKKKYLGKSGNEIEFDIAIESYHADSEECSNLTLIECKDYKTAIAVSKLRDFASSINDVGGNKGYFITTSNFQSGAVNHARSYKIGLARFPSSDIELNWILRRVGYKKHEERTISERRLYSESLAEDVNFVAICNYDHYANFIDFISYQLLDVDKNISIPYMTDEDIKSIAVETLEKTSGDIKSCITIDSIKYIVNDILCAKIITIPDWVTDDLGYCDFKRNTIYISPQLELNSPRWRFTIAHEIGHYLLHNLSFG